ncbi:adenosylmethionine decarboxylase [Agarivorans litoreus]|uniref:adenosylmethionine decarboxylase n=1 Tax=Agarivorans litoreus TaxID=1510455 RepID=UPI001C7CE0D3|nr:adenosylmethionine decarboxylase [Agarivorans litoreus]
MFFEGSEKKIELVVEAGCPPLRSLGYPFWHKVVKAAEADILSTLSNQYCDAYLLSESSLFVWDDRCLMLTCGNTTLVNSALLLEEHLGSDNIAFFSYQRKNEYQSQLQHTSLQQDLDKLRSKLPIKAYQLGYLDSHHHFLLHLDKPYTPAKNDITCELLMYHTQGPAADYLRSTHQTIEQIRALLKLDIILPDFELNDFLFEPFGYSVNAIRGKDYATIHITPEQHSSYVSFETNLNLGGAHAYIVKQLLAILQPASWDTVGFNCQPFSPLSAVQFEVGKCTQPLDCGYILDFRHYQHLQKTTLPTKQL